MTAWRGRAALTASNAIAALATGVGLYSAWHSGGQVWRSLTSGYRVYAGYTAVQRRHEAIAQIPLPSDVFDFYAAHLHRGDRIYFQVLSAPFGTYFDLPGLVAATGRFYLLPAVQVTDPRLATVVVSWREDPRKLHLHYLAQARYGSYGSELIFVSRLSG